MTIVTSVQMYVQTSKSISTYNILYIPLFGILSVEICWRWFAEFVE